MVLVFSLCWLGVKHQLAYLPFSLSKDAETNCTGPGQCVDHAECSSPTGGTCECHSDYYSSNGLCEERVQVPQPCKESRQCVANANCSPAKNMCLCNDGFYNDNGKCAGSKCSAVSGGRGDGERWAECVCVCVCA